MVSRYPTGKVNEKSERERVRGALTAVASTRRLTVPSYEPKAAVKSVKQPFHKALLAWGIESTDAYTIF